MAYRPPYLNMFMRLVANTAEPDNTNSCWLWTGPVRRHHYYNRPALSVRVNGKPVQRNAARMMLQCLRLLRIDEEASHLCDNTMCINPDHLTCETRTNNLNRRHNKNIAVPILLVVDTSDDPDWRGGTLCDPSLIPF